MTLSKYNEVMENLVVTEDMRKRLLSNVEKEMAGNGLDVKEATDKKSESDKAETIDDKPSEKNSGKRKIIEFRRYAGVAAAFCVLAVGAYAVIKVGVFDNKNSMSATSSYDAAETAMAPEAEYVTETAATEAAAEEEAIEYAAGTTEEALDGLANDSVGVLKESAEEQVGLMTAGPKLTEEDASLANSKFSIFEIFGKNGGEKSAQIKEYASLSKLSKAAMTDFKEIEYFDSFSSAKEYHLYDGKVALIYYDVAGNDVVVKEMSTKKGTTIPSKISGVTADMGSTSSVTVGDVTVTLKGFDDTYSIATWTVNGLVYELESSELLTYDDMKELMEEIIK